MRVAAAVFATVVFAAACASDDPAPGSARAPAGSGPAPTTTIDDYPDAITRTLRRLLAEPRPVPNSAIPPRHQDLERFPVSLVDRYDIVSGGPPPDGIASVDDPAFEPVDAVDGVGATEPVLVLTLDGETHVYPVRFMIRHEIVNDTVGGIPVVVSFCPLCNSALAYERTVAGRVTTFGTSGALYRSALVMYDRATESLWTHLDGRSVIGDLVGSQLAQVPIATVSFADAATAHPDAAVLTAPDAGREYDTNPYAGYDQIDGPVPSFFRSELDPRLPAMTRVVGIGVAPDADAVAVVRAGLASTGIVTVRTDDTTVSVWHAPGTVSPLQATTVAGGDDIGAVAAYATDETFTRRGDRFVDDATGSTWSLLGTALDGPRRGEHLTPVPHLDTFWFAWSATHPTTDISRPRGVTTSAGG